MKKILTIIAILIMVTTYGQIFDRPSDNSDHDDEHEYHNPRGDHDDHDDDDEPAAPIDTNICILFVGAIALGVGLIKK